MKTKIIIELEIECAVDDAAHAEEVVDRLLDEGQIQDLINHGPGEWSDECPGLLITNASCRSVACTACATGGAAHDATCSERTF